MKKLILSIILLSGFTGLNAGLFTGQAEKENQIERELHKVKEIKDLIDSKIEPCEPKFSARTFLLQRLFSCQTLPAEQRDVCLEKIKNLVENHIEKSSFWDCSNCPQRINDKALREFDEWIDNQLEQQVKDLIRDIIR